MTDQLGKIVVYKEDLQKVFNYYLSETREFLYKPATPAMEIRLHDKLEGIRRRKLLEDRSSAWEVKILVNRNETGTSFVIGPDLTNVEIKSRQRL